MVRQRPAKPSPPVRIRASPPDIENQTCGHGSAGRASPCQGEGRGFESRCPLHEMTAVDSSAAFSLFRSEESSLKRRLPKPRESTSRLCTVRIEKIFKIGSCKDSRFRYYIFLRLGPPRCDCWNGRLAQGESASLTRKRSQVQIL